MPSYERHFNKGYLVAIAAAIVYMSFVLLSNTQTLVTSLEKIKWEFLALILLSEFTVLLLRTARNRIFLRSIDINIPFSRNLLIYFAGLSMTITPGNAGELIRTQFLKREVGKPIASTIPIYFGERINDLVAVTVITSLFLIFVNFVEGKIVMAISVVIILIGFGILKNRYLFLLFRGKTNSIKFLQKFSDSFDQLHDSMQKLLTINVVKKTVPASFPIWLMHGISAYLAFLAFGINFDFMQTYVIYFTSLVIGVTSFVPGGIGVTETSLVGLLTIRGVNFSVAVGLTLVLRLFTIWFASMVGICVSRVLLSKSPSSRTN
jgi:uncharacterized protein (TIRG00374 family)